MKPKKEIALNKLFNFLQILGLLLLAIGIALLIDTEIYWGLGFCIPAIAVIILTGFFTPACYIFSNDSVTFYYLFSKNEQYLWENIYSITVDYDRFAPHSSSGIFSLFFGSVFSIEGNVTDDLLFYMSGYIRKSFRTSYLLKKYYDGEINGFFWEDVKKRFSKNKKEIKRDFSEVAIMEASARKEARSWIAPHSAIIRQFGRNLKTDFIYIDKDFNELKYRPESDYRYTVIASIEQPIEERDKENVYEVSADLINVRRGKKKFVGVISKTSKEELDFYLSEMVKDFQTDNH